MAQNDDGSLKILVCGKTGVGKSTLINSLFACDVCKVNNPGLTGNFRRGTAKVTEWKATLNSVGINLIDSPGLQDGEGSDDEYLKAMHEKCKDVDHLDLVLYCVEMTAARFGEAEIKPLQLFTKEFGPDFWKRCVLVMTKANCVSIPLVAMHTNKARREYHRNLYNTMLKTFREELEKEGVSNTIRDSMPACAVGNIEPGAEEYEDDGRKIWYVSDKLKPELEPVKVEFLTEFWLTCLERMSGGPRWNLMKCTEHRLKPSENTEEIIHAKSKFEKMKSKLDDIIRKIAERTTSHAEHGRVDLKLVLDEKYDLKPNEDQIERLVSMGNEDIKLFSAVHVGATVGSGAAGAAGGAATGAVIGSVVPVVGTAVGGLVGGIIGGVGGLGLGAIGAGIRYWRGN